MGSERNAFQLHRDKQRQRRSLQCLLLLPLILAFCWLPSAIRRLVDIFIPDPTWSFMPLDYLCVAVGPLQGFLNAIVYGFTPAVRDAMTGRMDHRARMLKGMTARLGSAWKPSKKRFAHFQDDAEAASSSTPGDGPRHAAQRDDSQIFGGSSFFSEDDSDIFGDAMYDMPS